jgi:hypothetical protein
MFDGRQDVGRDVGYGYVEILRARGLHSLDEHADLG